jgi:hypothetical protein
VAAPLACHNFLDCKNLTYVTEISRHTQQLWSRQTILCFFIKLFLQNMHLNLQFCTDTWYFVSIHDFSGIFEPTQTMVASTQTWVLLLSYFQIF